MSLFPMLIVANRKNKSAVIMYGSAKVRSFDNCIVIYPRTTSQGRMGRVEIVSSLDASKHLASYPEKYTAVEWRDDEEGDVTKEDKKEEVK